jgi:hypothetical protein
MFYDQSAGEGRRFSAYRTLAIAAAAILVPPFIALAVVPMVVILIPVAFVVVPFMVPAFFGGAHASGIESKNILLWRPALAVAGAQHA